jgi:hypothetical protein
LFRHDDYLFVVASLLDGQAMGESSLRSVNKGKRKKYMEEAGRRPGGRGEYFFFCGVGTDDGQTSCHPAKNMPKQKFGNNILGN